jgi:Mor family transcriptional regulator
MSYVKAQFILPKDLLELIQEYAQGQYLYIPKKEEDKKSWGENTQSKINVRLRDSEIYGKYRSGIGTSKLAEEYYLSLKSIQRIILKEKRNSQPEVNPEDPAGVDASRNKEAVS